MINFYISFELSTEWIWMNIKNHFSLSRHLLPAIALYPTQQNWKCLHIRNRQYTEFHNSNFLSCRRWETSSIFLVLGIWGSNKFWSQNLKNQALLSQSFKIEKSDTWSSNQSTDFWNALYFRTDLIVNMYRKIAPNSLGKGTRYTTLMFDVRIDDTAEGGLTIVWELFTMIPSAPKHLTR